MSMVFFSVSHPERFATQKTVQAEELGLKALTIYCHLDRERAVRLTELRECLREICGHRPKSSAKHLYRPTIARLCGQMAEAVKGGVKLIIVDHLEAIEPVATEDNDGNIAVVIDELRGMSDMLDVHVVLTSVYGDYLDPTTVESSMRMSIEPDARSVIQARQSPEQAVT